MNSFLEKTGPPLNRGLAYLEELVMIQLDPVLQPGDLRSRDTDRHAEERDLSAQHVIQLEVGRLHDLGTLRKTRRDGITRSRTDTQNTRLLSTHILVLVIVRTRRISIGYQDVHSRTVQSSSATAPPSTTAALLCFCAHH